MSNINLPEFDDCPRAVALDLDGTLLDSRSQVSERSRRAIQKLVERDIPVIFATSRPARTLARVFPDGLADLCSLVGMNGAVAIGRPPLSGYFRDTLPHEFASDIRITIEMDGYDFGSNREIDPDQLWERNAATPDMVMSVEKALEQQPSKIVLGAEMEDLLKLRKVLRDNLGDTVLIIPALAGPPILNITTPQSTKTDGIRRLLKPAGIGLSEVIAFGDDLPDLGMLQSCGTSVAMSNACDEVITACSYLTASNDEDGVALVLEALLKSYE